MSIARQRAQENLPFPFDDVFDAVVAVMPSIGFTVKSQDRAAGRVTASTGMSLFSWGEDLTVVVEKVDESTTVVAIESKLKLSINIMGALRHKENFRNLIQALGANLRGRSARKA